MKHWDRVLYAGVLTAVLLSIFLLVAAFISPDLVRAFFGQHYWIPVLVLSYLVAPVLSRYIKRK